VRVGVTLACIDCKNRNYTTEKKQKEQFRKVRAKKILPCM
jgi:large subunit ribosomal protein L33